MNNFWQRTLTGAIFAVVMIGMTWLHAISFLILLMAIVLLGTFELARMINIPPVKAQRIPSFLLSALTIIAGFGITFYHLPKVMMLALVPVAVGVLLYELYRNSERPFWNIAVTLFIPVYVAVPFLFLMMIAFMDGDYNPAIVLSFIGMIWTSDTGAYLSGVTMGKHKFFPRISPKKSWEGFIGGVVLTLLLGWGLAVYLQMPLALMLGMALIISVLGAMSDLVESMLKRSVGAKDSGTLLPGHGGILDRFDAFVLTAPMVYFYFELYNYLIIIF